MYEPPLFAFSTLIGAIHSRHSIRDVRRILIYKLDHLGDVLLTTPALRAIRRRFPNAEIRVVVGEWSRPVLQGNPNIDRVIIHNSGAFARTDYAHHTFADLKRQLGSWQPNLVIGLRDDWRTLAASLFSPVRRIERGRLHLREWWSMKWRGNSYRHELDRIWETLRPLGITPDPEPRLDYFVTDEERQRAISVMIAQNIRRPFAVIHSGASTPLKEWPLERYAEVARHVAEQLNLSPVLIGTAQEAERSAQLAEMIADLDPVDISGRYGLRDTAAIIERASLYVASDGGMMHIATALDIPTVGLFGPGAVHVFRPAGRQAVAISHEFPCSPCYMETCIRPHDNCMHAITVDEVVRETERLVGDRIAGGELVLEGIGIKKKKPEVPASS
jgi:ADP-heptose:LPS heptosyltransferase